jgi:outer membrane protein insertion porin family
MAISSSKTKPSINLPAVVRTRLPAAPVSVRPYPEPIRSLFGWVFLFHTEMKSAAARHLIAAILCCLPCGAAHAIAQTEDERPMEVATISFEGNSAFDDGKLRDALSSKETPGGFSQFLFRTFGEKLGSGPEFFEEAKFEDDITRMRALYREAGYYRAEITGSHRVDTSDNAVEIHYVISERERSYVDSVALRGLDTLRTEILEAIFKEPLIQRGQPYERAKASAEVSRILGILANNGYPTARFMAEQSTAEHYLSTNNFFLTFVFDPGLERAFGEVNIHVEPDRPDITDNLTLRQLDFQTGDLYSRDKRVSSERNLNRIGLFERATIDNAVVAETSRSRLIPMDIHLFARPRNELAPELLISDENNAFNLGLGLGYTNRNFLGDGRAMSARARARTQSIRDLIAGHGYRDSVVIAAVDFDLQVVQPYLFSRRLSGSITGTFSLDKQALYILSILRTKLGLTNQFATYTFGSVEWTLERVSPEIIDPLNSPNLTAILRLEDQPQFNSIITFTLQRDKTNDIFSPTAGFFNSMSLEESGVLAKLVPGIGSGLPFTQYYKVTLYSRRYQDLTGTRFSILALKLKGGYQDKYGESRSSNVSIPLNRRFFGGGSGSVRGWKARELGAMPDELLQFGGNFLLEGSVELRVNHFRGFGKLGFLKMDNIWGVYFVDFGNVWSSLEDFKFRDVALSTGIGFRYDTFFGPFRIDYGFRLYDPKEVAGRQTVFQRRFFAETLGAGVWHFGIGHAF